MSTISMLSWNCVFFWWGDILCNTFTDEFEFQDPYVTLLGIKAYEKAVNVLFDQSTSFAKIIEEKSTRCTLNLKGLFF